ncbi:hypothetical protein QOT17_009986 [Balamuthia mandrillaris]
MESGSGHELKLLSEDNEELFSRDLVEKASKLSVRKGKRKEIHTVKIKEGQVVVYPSQGTPFRLNAASATVGEVYTALKETFPRHIRNLFPEEVGQKSVQEQLQREKELRLLAENELQREKELRLLAEKELQSERQLRKLSSLSAASYASVGAQVCRGQEDPTEIITNYIEPVDTTTLQSLWVRVFNEIPIPEAGGGEPQLQHFMDQMVRLITHQGPLKEFNNSYILPLRPDISLVSSTDNCVQWNNLVMTGEIETNLQEKLNHGLGQAVTYGSRALLAQTARQFIFCILTSVDEIMFVRITREEKMIARTNKMPLFPLVHSLPFSFILIHINDFPLSLSLSLSLSVSLLFTQGSSRPTFPTEGFEILVRLLRSKPDKHGYQLPSFPETLVVGEHCLDLNSLLGLSTSLVYKATMESGTVVAVKCTPQGNGQFQSELQALQKLKGIEGVPSLIGYGACLGLNYDALIMAPCGLPLLQMIQSGDGFLPCEQAYIFAVQVLGVLEEAHQRGVMHGDIRPHNLVLANERMILVDWGLALLSEDVAEIIVRGSGHFSPTGLLLAEEEQRAYTYTMHDDLESLAYTIAWMMNGMLPWQSSSCTTRKALLKSRDSFQFPNAVQCFLDEIRSLRGVSLTSEHYDRLRGCFADEKQEEACEAILSSGRRKGKKCGRVRCHYHTTKPTAIECHA